MSRNRRATLELTGQLYLLLKRSEIAYRDYLSGGRTFRHAKILKYYNDKTRSAILEKGFILPDVLQSDALAIVRHIDYWMQRWDDLAIELNPTPDDEFVFPNDITFPRDAAKNIEQEYHKLKLELADGR